MIKITGDEPASPMIDVAFNAKLNSICCDQNNGDFNTNFPGLTIRQELAKSFTASMITGIVSGSGKDAHGWSDKDFVKSGFSLADAFIEELNKEV